MSLNAEHCYRALQARDARFDGRFFTAVRTTGTYCRPICPARTPLAANVEFFPSAAGAHAAGYRPCLRCRPELAPDSPAAAGTLATVQRGLRLIHAGALDQDSVEQLASRLGVTARHLRRLFLEHLGAPPVQVASTRRILFAKTLITDTALPMAQVAYAAGFQSLRRFNHVLRTTYDRPPTALRRSPAVAAEAAPAIELQLAYRAPYDWPALTGFLHHRLLPGLEAVDQDGYRRGGVMVRRHASADALVARIACEPVSEVRATVERIRFLFDLRADTAGIAAHLRKSPALRAIAGQHAGLRLPGCWDGFELAVRAVLGQQVTVKGAATLAARLVQRLGAPQAHVLAEADLAAIGLTPARAAALRGLARAVAEGAIQLDGSVASSEVIARLCELPGIGPWTANYIAMRALGDTDAFPATDLGLLKAAGVTSARRLLEIAEAWRPWRAYAAMYLWNSLTKGGSNAVARI